jgi:hypothetical protein
MGNYVIAVGNYLIVSPSELGNYKIADTVPGVLRGLSGVAGGMVFVNQITAFSCGEGLRCA